MTLQSKSEPGLLMCLARLPATPMKMGSASSGSLAKIRSRTCWYSSVSLSTEVRLVISTSSVCVSVGDPHCLPFGLLFSTIFINLINLL